MDTKRVKIEDIVVFNTYTKQFAVVESMSNDLVRTKGAGSWPVEEAEFLSSEQLKRLNEYENVHSSWVHPTEEHIKYVMQ